MSSSVVCFRCGQDWLERVRLVRLNRVAVRCPECEALWLDEANLASDAWVDYGTFMREAGCADPDRKEEIEFLEQLIR